MSKPKYTVDSDTMLFLEDYYYEWLSEKLVRNKRDSEILQWLHEWEFVVKHPMDENRAVEGAKVRVTWQEECFVEGHYAIEDDDPFLLSYCTVLELIVGIVYRYERYTGECNNRTRFRKYFWELVGNVFSPAIGVRTFDKRLAISLMHTFLDRGYLENGQGGLFPLTNAKVNMRETELWYQMQYYLEERYPGVKH